MTSKLPIHQFFIIFFLILSGLSIPVKAFSNFDSEESIVVKLDTESDLMPVYLLPIFVEDSEFSSSYLQKLNAILTFDLNHNGSTIVVKNNLTEDQLGQTSSFDQLGHTISWRDRHIAFVIKAMVHGNHLSALMLDVQKNSMKKTDELPLTGVLEEDRRKVHRLADILYKAMFGTDGIATTRILYSNKINTSNDQKGIAEIWESDYDGANKRQITKDNSLSLNPAYVPPKPGLVTGSFLYVSYQTGQPKIYLSSLKTGAGQRMTTLRGNQFMPAISRQRDQIAFISDITGNPDLFLQPFNMETGPVGKPQQIFSARQATQGSPTFSPDGKKLAFVSNKDGTPKIYVITIPNPGVSLKDIKATLITRKNRENTSPAWSPDGSMIAYSSKGSGERQIWVYDFKTNQERQITQGPLNKENPSWAPNNMMLVYNTAEKYNNELYLISINGGEATQITSGPSEKRFPNWESR